MKVRVRVAKKTECDVIFGDRAHTVWLVVDEDGISLPEGYPFIKRFIDKKNPTIGDILSLRGDFFMNTLCIWAIDEIPVDCINNDMPILEFANARGTDVVYIQGGFLK